MSTYSNLTDEQQKTIETRWMSGDSAASLDREFGLTVGAVSKIAHRLSWKRDETLWKNDVEVERLKSQYSALNKKYSQAVKETVAVNRLVDTLRETVKAAPPVKALKIPKAKDGHSPHSAVALVSDVHVGEVVSATETNNLGSYNTEIFYSRLQRWTEALLELVEIRRHRLHIPTLNLFFLGDIVSGDIHDELSNTNDANIVEQTIIAAQGFSDALLAIAPYFEQIEISGVVGNHGRMARKPYFKERQTRSFDYLVYKMMEMTLAKQSNISFHIPESFWTIRDVLGTKFLLLHGDGNQSWSGLPWYGIQRMTLKLMEMIGRDITFDRVVMGHFHDPVDTERWHINGSFKGGDEYSIGKLYTTGRPSQTLMYIHPINGVVGTERIYLDKPGDRKLILADYESTT